MWNVVSMYLKPLKLYPLYIKEVSETEVIVYTFTGKKIKVYLDTESVTSIQFL